MRLFPGTGIPFVLFLLVLTLAIPAKAQQLTVDGTVLENGLKLGGASVKVYDGSSLVNEYTTKPNGTFEISMDLDKVFTLVFGKEGYVSKRIEVDTRDVPEDDRSTANFHYGRWKVEIFRDNLGVDISVLDQPIGKVTYNPTYLHFANDNKYTKSIQRQLDDLLTELERAREEQEMLAEQLEKDYELAVADGDAFMKEGDYENARFQYQAAVQLKPEEKYPQKQIDKVDQLLGDQQAKEEQYIALLTQADDAFNSEQWLAAKELYSSALDVKPAEKYPREQIEECDKNQAESEKRGEYDKLIAAADAAFDGQQYPDARKGYTDALALFPKEEHPKSRLSEIDDIEKASQQKEAEFNRILAQADRDLEAQKLEEAKAGYQQAGELFPSREEPPAGIQKVDALLASLAADKAAQEKAEQERLARLRSEYEALIAEADEQMTANEWASAKQLYTSAKEKQPEETYPDQQLAEIDRLIAEAGELEKQYQSKLSEGDKLLAKKQYEEAKTAYQAAASLKPDETVPPAKIQEVDSMLAQLAADAAAKEQAEQERLAQLKAEYDALIADADQKFANEQLTEARSVYQQAQEKQPEEAYPGQKITEIDGLLAAQADRDERYADLIKQADKQLAAQSYAEARDTHSQAGALKPEETVPPSKIQEIDDILAQLAADEAARQQAEQERLAQLKAEYDALIADADQKLANEQLVEAKSVYQQAQEKQPEEAYPGQKITEIDALLADQADRDERYADLIKQADKQLAAKSYTEARDTYSQAAALKPDETVPPAKIQEIDGILAQLAADEAARQQAEQERLAKLKAEYDALIADADQKLANEQLAEAKSVYQQAQEKQPEEAYPGQKIVEIDALLAEQADLDERYADLIKQAGNQLAAKSYSEARDLYSQAGALKPNETVPPAKIQEIDGILAQLAADEAAREKAEQERLAKLKAEYDALIAEADEQRDEALYPQAIALYEQAASKQPSETYPGEQITLIKAKQAELANQARAYDQEIAVADKLFAQKQWEEAKTRYQNALEIKPGESHPTGQIAAIDKQLAALAEAEEARLQAEAAAAAEREENYKRLLARADASFSQEAWEDAINAYEEASTVKPEETYPREQIALIRQKQEAQAAAEAAERKRAEEEAAKRDQFTTLIQAGDAFYQKGEYAEAKPKYEQAVALYPEETHPQQRLTEIEKILAEQAAEEAARQQAEAERIERDNKYQEAITRANTAFNGEQYEEAKSGYEEALTIKPNEAYPQSKITEIESILAELERRKQEELLAQQRQAEQEAKYNGFIETADKALAGEEYDNARENYESALQVKPEDPYAKAQIKKVVELIEAERKRLAAASANDTEFNTELARNYPQGRTERTYDEGNKKVTQIIIVEGNRGDEYIFEKYSWGQEFYLKNGKRYNKTNWLQETRKK